jgi:hypothetical protein
LFAAAAATALVLTACHSATKSPGVAALTSPATSHSPSSDAQSGSGGSSGGSQGGGQLGVVGGSITVAYSQCMRTHGVPTFPDPNAQGQVEISNNGAAASGIDPRSATFQAAQTACQKYLPSGGTANPSQQAQNKANALKYSQCMRSHGITNFPDPDADGGISISSGSGIDPQSPQFQAAQSVCRPLMGGGNDTTTNNGGSGS